MSKRNPAFSRLARYVKPYFPWVAVTVLASLCVAAIDIVLGKAIERLAEGTIGSPVAMILMVLAMVLVGMPCKFMIKYASAKFSVSALRDLRNELADRFGDLTMSNVERRFTGDLVSRLTNNTAVLQNFFIQHFANLFYLPVVFIGALTLLLLTSWKLVLSSLVLMPLGIVLAALLNKPIQSYSAQLQEKISELNVVAQDAIGGIAIVKAFNMQAAFLKKYSLIMDEVIRQGLRMEKRYAAITPIGVALFSTPIILVIAFGGYLIAQGELSAGGIVLFLYLITFILQPISMLPTMISQIKEAAGAAQHLFEALDWPTERKGSMNLPVRPAAAPVRFEAVTFSYDGETKVLDGISFQVNEGETVAFVGGSGGGKSTLFKLLCGFYEPGPDGDGTIEVFGRPLSDWDPSELRARLSLVSQESYLFPATIAENIGYGRADATREEIVEAAKAAHAHEFIMQLPQGYETPLGERGGGLSGGQKQRIAIARAFLKDTPLLLLDEPTSALDSHSEALVQSALKSMMGGRTVLVIAHRLSTVRQADRIIVLDQGRIAESGTHDELLRHNGVYSKLYVQQFAAAEDEDTAGLDRSQAARGGERDLQAGVR
ncbi:ABC transporter ATP-binding protein [Paenibacillus tyrfis]|uniref:ABC transporter ATP-binding protein n=1 Tax=Paenibacillus tyrfis TaxID=1501230 RepID=UPI00248FB2CE|nr:ABC transporter ATP-binding protein [Paenibacillus tyrfis]GLI08027.1 ABC transporter ATP-binding protein [Paenibacillus tyrfis]